MLPSQAQSRFVKAIGGKGLFMALALAGAGIQGCNTGDAAPSAPAASSPSAAAPAEGKTDAGAVPGGAVAARSGSYEYVCIGTTTWSNWFYQYAEARNSCSTPKRVRMIWSLAYDGQCVTLPAHGSHTEKRSKPSWWYDTVDC
jgi:hypothetical protein